MTKKPIRNLHTAGVNPPRFCDVVVDGEHVYLEQKVKNGKFVTIPWEDVVHQVHAAMKINNQKLPPSAP